jgi:tryptophan synthase beta chain
MLHQTVIGQEARLQMAMAGEDPDVVIGCFGGGSNFGGLALPYVLDKFAGSGPKIVAVEPAACPSLTRGAFAYDFGDTAKLTPLIKMYTLGHDFVPPGIHAGGLRYHGASPLLSHLVAGGYIEARAVTQLPVFEAALQFARTEGILPAPESAHAIRAAIDEALSAREEARGKVVLFCLSGHGHFDLASYESYLTGKLQDYEYPGRDIEKAMAAL